MGRVVVRLIMGCWKSISFATSTEFCMSIFYFLAKNKTFVEMHFQRDIVWEATLRVHYQQGKRSLLKVSPSSGHTTQCMDSSSGNLSGEVHDVLVGHSLRIRASDWEQFSSLGHNGCG